VLYLSDREDFNSQLWKAFPVMLPTGNRKHVPCATSHPETLHRRRNTAYGSQSNYSKEPHFLLFLSRLQTGDGITIPLWKMEK